MEPRTFQERRRQPSADVAAGGRTVFELWGPVLWV